MTKNKKVTELEQQNGELLADLQRIRADFENYRKMMDVEKQKAREASRAKTIMDLLPIVDTIQRAITHVPSEIADNQWVKGVEGLARQLEKLMADLAISRIDASQGVAFNPELHQAVQFDEDSEGEKEVIAEELQAGYTIAGVPLRHAMVKVTRI